MPGGANCKLGDADLQAELTRQINMGVLPAPTLDCTGNANTLYMVDFPANISLSAPGGAGRSCVNNGFCGYHNTGTYGAASTPSLVYAALMDVFTGPCKNGCGGNALALDNATDLASHELVEAATDADIGLDLQLYYAAPAGWGDNDNQCGEVGYICDDGSPGDTITVSGRKWVVQQIWSQAQGKCASTGPAPAICSGGTTSTGCRLCSCGDDGLACHGATSVCETTSSNVLFGGCEACTATSASCSGGTCVQSTTPAMDDICSNCTPATTCPAGFTCGTTSNGCGGTLTCGTCTAPQTCGGGTPSNPNACGCGPITKCPSGVLCGTDPDGCGGTVNCGNCTPPTTCGGGGHRDPRPVRHRVHPQDLRAARPHVWAGHRRLWQHAQLRDVHPALHVRRRRRPRPVRPGHLRPGDMRRAARRQLRRYRGRLRQHASNCGLLPARARPAAAVASPTSAASAASPLTCAEKGFNCGVTGDGAAASSNCGDLPHRRDLRRQRQGQRVRLRVQRQDVQPARLQLWRGQRRVRR